MIKSWCKYTIIPFFLLLNLGYAGTRTVTWVEYNSAARDTYLAPLNLEKTRFEGATKNLTDTIEVKNKEIQTIRLALSDLYGQREDILVGREDLILEYQNQKARHDQAKQVSEVLNSLLDLIELGMNSKLSNDAVVILNSYNNAKTEDRVLISKELQKLIAREIDPEQKDALLSLQKTLLYYGLTLQGGEEKQAGNLVATALDQLIKLMEGEQKALRDIFEIIEATAKDFSAKVESTAKAVISIKSEANADFDSLEAFNLQITAHNKTIHQNKSYNEILLAEIKKCEEAMKELEQKIALAPPVVAIKKSRTEYNDLGGGINR